MMSFSTFLFNTIAPVYGLFFKRQVKHFKQIIPENKDAFDLLKYDKILDVGCGTGALAYALSDMGVKVTGVDPAKRMLKVARKKINSQGVICTKGSVTEGLPFDDNSFPVSIMSHVAHGLKPNKRAIMYEEMKRVTSDFVIFHDYNGVRHPLVDTVEFFERGDYFNFIKGAKKEMETHFKSVTKVNVSKRTAWYICEV